jgi:hypothetical protein
MFRYSLRWLLMVLFGLLLVALICLVVDPYGIFRFVDKPGFNAIKPMATTRGGMAKAYGVQREQPKGLILGNSRAEVGFDPEHAAWPKAAQPAFSLSIAGTGPTTSWHFFRHALATRSDTRAPHQDVPHTVVWGVDFMDYLVRATDAPNDGTPSDDVKRLALSPSDLSGLPYRQHQIKDFAESTLTARALIDSAVTLWSQKQPFAADQTRLGFNPMQEYLKIAADQGYWAIFRQKDHTYIQSFLDRPKDIFDSRGNTSPQLENTRKLLRLSRERGIRVHLVIYPYHAYFQQSFRITGHWAAFEAWKRAMVKLVNEEAREAQQAPVALWDFSGFNAYTSESVPEQQNRQAQMRWYWESGHFKRELGNLVLNRVLQAPSAVQGELPGVLLTELNLESHLEKLRQEERDYRLQNAAPVASLQALADSKRPSGQAAFQP